MDIFSLLDTIQTIARNGLRYTSSEYDKERYERLLEMAVQTYSELLSAPEENVKQRFLDEVGTITPKVGTDAAIFNEAGEILLMERSDGSGWCLPCGFVEPNESPPKGSSGKCAKRPVLKSRSINWWVSLPANQAQRWGHTQPFRSCIYAK